MTHRRGEPAAGKPGPATAAMEAEISGMVQGVGFRPHVYCLAEKLGIAGTVQNTPEGVFLHVEGPETRVREFFSSLEQTPPPLARISSMTVSGAACTGKSGFTILGSASDRAPRTLVSPDAATCEACLAEMSDPADRRHGYPFINCTVCGPRFTITEKLPYDRPNTSMRGFSLCPDCRAEYENPRDRRFHAQPLACPECGPRTWLADPSGRVPEERDPISRAVELLIQGRIGAIKGVGGFHLAVDATNETAVDRLRQKKNRPEKPLAVMARDLDQARTLATISHEEEGLLLSRARPIVAVEKRTGCVLAENIAPGLNVLGVMLPYSPLHHLLLEKVTRPLVMTSGNRAGEPLCKDNREALENIGAIADFFLLHDRDIVARCDDSVVMTASGHSICVRRSRGYAPSPLPLRHGGAHILAVGAELKNTFCLVKENQAFVSQHMGNLNSARSLENFEEAVEHFCGLYGIRPEVLVHDLHPDYLSTRYAREAESGKTVGVQHHLAHVLSCLAENGFCGPALGLAFDGVGLGTDRAAWGGEVLVARVGSAEFVRAAHLGYVPLPGGDKAADQPWRMGLSHLLDAFGPDLESLDLPFLAGLDPEKRAFVEGMVKKGVNSPPTSSMGRLFDAVAALCGIRLVSSYEGQAAMELEAVAEPGEFPAYGIPWEPGTVVPPAPLVRAVALDLAARTPVPRVAARFHATVADLFSRVAAHFASEHGLGHVAFSGGVFQNRRLLSAMARACQKAGLTVLVHGRIPPNDGGVSLGQAAAMVKP